MNGLGAHRGQTDRQTDGQTDRQTEIHFYIYRLIDKQLEYDDEIQPTVAPHQKITPISKSSRSSLSLSAL